MVRFEIQPAPGVNVNKIVNLQKNLAMALAADSIRIEAPIPGKSAVGIEVSRPVEDREMVVARDLIASDEFKSRRAFLLCAGQRILQAKRYLPGFGKNAPSAHIGNDGIGQERLYQHDSDQYAVSGDAGGYTIYYH